MEVQSLGRPSGGGNGNPLQDSCLKNPMDRGAWWATVQGSQRVRYNLVTEHAHTQASLGDSWGHGPDIQSASMSEMQHSGSTWWERRLRSVWSCLFTPKSRHRWWQGFNLSRNDCIVSFSVIWQKMGLQNKLYIELFDGVIHMFIWTTDPIGECETERI